MREQLIHNFVARGGVQHLMTFFELPPIARSAYDMVLEPPTLVSFQHRLKARSLLATDMSDVVTVYDAIMAALARYTPHTQKLFSF